MIWKLLQWTFIILCDPLMAADAGKEKLLVTRVQVPLQVLSSMAASITNNSGSQGSTNTLYAVSLPSMNCINDYDCLQYGDLVCSMGQCSCRPPMCWIYQYVVTGFFAAKNVFSCGECGVLGSSCNATIECDYPGECLGDGFCHCENGENYDGVCVTSDMGWSSTLALIAIGILIFFIICSFAINCFRVPPWRNPDAWLCMCCYDRGGSHRRRGSCEKSPAFTIQTHYASQDLAVCLNSVQEEATVGIGGAVPRRHGSVSSDNIGTMSSISSAVTNLTNVSDSSSRESTDRTLPPSPPRSSPPTPSPPPPPPPPYTPPPPPPLPPSHKSLKSNEDGNKGYCSDVSSTELNNVPHEEFELPSTSNTLFENEESKSVSISVSCTHERCQLCLPRSHTSRPRATNATRRQVPNKTDNPLFPLLDIPHAQDIQLTQL